MVFSITANWSQLCVVPTKKNYYTNLKTKTMEKRKGHKYVNHKALHIGGLSNSYFIAYTNKSNQYRRLVYKSDSLELAFRNFKEKYPNREIVEIRESNS